MEAPRHAVRRFTTLGLFLTLLLSFISSASAQTYYFSGAVQVSQPVCNTCNSGTAAVQAVCPAGNPTSCDSIGVSGYCCPADNTCSWSNSQVACCQTGCTCTGWQAAGGYNGPVSSYYAPTSTYYAPTTTYYTPANTVAGGGVVVVTQQATQPAYQQQTTTAYYYGGNYCSTLTAKGDVPPEGTTALGGCGTILVVPASEGVREAMSWLRVVAAVVGLQVLGAMVVFGRR